MLHRYIKEYRRALKSAGRRHRSGFRWVSLPVTAAMILTIPTFGGAQDAPETFPVQRCMNMSNALEAPNEGEWTYRIEFPHLAEIAAAGFDTIRLPVRFSNHFDGTSIDPSVLARVDSVIEEAMAQGLTVILDLHHFEEIMVDPEAHADTFVAIWRALADHYEGWPNRLLFELLNEPFDALTTDKAVALYDRVIPIIREKHPERWLVYGGGTWNSIDEMERLPEPADDRIAHTFHYYSPFKFTHAGAYWMEEPPEVPPRPISRGDRRELREAMERASQASAPVLLGEFGVYREATDLTARAAWVRETREAAEAFGLAWCHWGFAAEFRSWDPDTKEWIPEMRDALLGS